MEEDNIVILFSKKKTPPLQQYFEFTFNDFLIEKYIPLNPSGNIFDEEFLCNNGILHQRINVFDYNNFDINKFILSNICERFTNVDDMFKLPDSQYKPIKEPLSIFVNTIDKLNVLKIHEIIWLKYCYMLHTCKEQKEKKINKLQSNEVRDNVSEIDKKFTHNKLLQKISYYDTILTFKVWNEYIHNVKDIIIDYYNEVFEGNKIYNDVYLAIYKEYASKIIDINIINDNHHKNVCKNCGKEEIQDLTKATNECCCGFGRNKVLRIGSSYEVTTMDMYKNSYEDLVNFIRRIDAYEGIQVSPPKELFNIVEKYLDSIQEVKCSNIRKIEADVYGKKPNTSIKLIENALYKTKNSYFYKDSELIAKTVWGWILPDLTNNGMRDQIIKDYIKTQKIYEKNKKRESSLNIHIRLFYHLKVRDYPCDINDFKIISSQKSLKYHKEMFTLFSKECGFPIIDI